jgi:hypothetical protein
VSVTLTARLAVLLWAVLAPLAVAADLDPPFPAHRAEYLLTRDGLPVANTVMELKLLPDGGYRYRSTTLPHAALALVGKALELDAAARIIEESSGQFVDGRFRPQRYLYRRVNEDHRTLSVTFDWTESRAAMESEGKPWSMKVPDGTLDKLVVLLALRQDLASGMRDPSYSVADGGKLKTYRFERKGDQEIVTPAGTWLGVEVARSKDESPADYRLWLAPDLDYLPVRVEREEMGSRFRMDLTLVEGLGD